MSGDWHAVTCSTCKVRKVVKSRGYPRNWRVAYNSQGYYTFDCPDCQTQHVVPLFALVIPEREAVDAIP